MSAKREVQGVLKAISLATEDKEAVVRSWIESLGWTCEGDTPEEAGDSWRLHARTGSSGSSVQFSVFWPEVPADCLQLRASVEFPAPYGEAFSMMSAAERMAFVCDMGRCLSRFPVAHHLLTTDDEQIDERLTPPTGVVVVVTVPAEEGVTRKMFYKAYLAMAGACLEANYMVNKMGIMRTWR